MAGARRKRFQLGIKRTLDVVVSASVLVALSPLLLLTALAIMLETMAPSFRSPMKFITDVEASKLCDFGPGRPMLAGC
jgi:hypothetical protein